MNTRTSPRLLPPALGLGCLLVSLLSLLGCSDDDGACPAGFERDAGGACVRVDPDAGADTDAGPGDLGVDPADGAAEPCEGRCDADEQCAADGSCVACLEDAHCDDPSAPVCDTTGSCVAGCAADDACARFASTPACDESAGVCVTCDADETTLCDPSESCDLIAHACVPREIRGLCETCTNDDQCSPGHRCVPMTYAGAPRGDGGYCLRTVADAGICPRPYQDERDASSLNAPDEVVEVCSLVEDLQTCEAVRQMQRAAVCVTDGACADATGSFVAVEGALCRNVGGEMRCTVPCTGPVMCEPPGANQVSESIVPTKALSEHRLGS